MLTRHERNELLGKVNELTTAWERLLNDVRNEAPSRHGASALVLDLTEKLTKFIEEDLS